QREGLLVEPLALGRTRSSCFVEAQRDPLDVVGARAGSEVELGLVPGDGRVSERAGARDIPRGEPLLDLRVGVGGGGSRGGGGGGVGGEGGGAPRGQGCGEG